VLAPGPSAYHAGVTTDPASGPTLPDDPAPFIAPEGQPIVAWFFAVAALLSAAAFWFAGSLGALIAVPLLLVALWSFWFFRDPARRVPAEPGAIISPADGVICGVTKIAPPAELGIDPAVGGQMTRVSVFMNVFNVHVNRAPEAGKVVRIAYRPGKFFNASFDKASEFNERCSYAMALPDGRPIVFVQIAGLIARRIVWRIAEGATLRRGERFGLIRFGSRVDTYLPPGVEPRVKVGDKSVAGETVFAVLSPMPAAAIEAGASSVSAGNPVGATPIGEG
jgi:phosphatidylserine decarboxylase